ncbi:MAG: SRPBCC domain-containing protein [Bacteroidales bacterium]|nr:SRPBCC domain-containing protein [Candidatus Physcocola equi]
MAKIKFTIEYDFENVPLNLLWQFLYTNQGLETWYADEVTNEGKDYTIVWDGEAHEAALLTIRQGSHIRFHWKADGDEPTYFEMRILVSELTHGRTLMVTDFASDDEEVEDFKELWNNSVDQLKHNLGI